MEVFSIVKLAELLDKELNVATRKALELAYLLSTTVEEGRSLRFAFLQSPTNYLPERKLKRPVKGGDAIRLLCLAANLEENVWRIEHDAEKDDIVVTGLANYPFEPFLFPPFAERDILIEVDDVGSVAIRVADEVAKYSGCRHYKPNAEKLLPPLIPDGVIDAVAQSGIKTAGLDKNNPYIYGQSTCERLAQSATNLKARSRTGPGTTVTIGQSWLCACPHSPANVREGRHGYPERP